MFATRRHHKRIIIINNDSILDSAESLKASNILNSISRSEHGVLAGGLLAAAPPRVPEEVDVGGPEGEPGLAHVKHGAGLAGDGGGGAEPEGAVEGGGGEDDLGEAGGGGDGAGEGDAGAVEGEAVEGLGPPLVGGDAEAGDGGGVVGEEEDLLRESEEGHEGARTCESGEGSVAEGVGLGEFASVVSGACCC